MSVAYAIAFTVCTMTVSTPPPTEPKFEDCQKIQGTLNIPDAEKFSNKTRMMCRVEMNRRASIFNRAAQWSVIQKIQAKSYPFSEKVVKKGSCIPLEEA